MIESYGISEVGCVRRNNQDRILMDHSLGLFVVADGVGGHNHGEVAAELTVSSLRYYVEASQDRFDISWPFGYEPELSIDANRLSTGIRLANQRVRGQAAEEPRFTGMATTVAALLLNDSKAIVGSVGDSRVYLFRNSILRQLSVDDSWNPTANSPTDSGECDFGQDYNKNILTQAIGSTEVICLHMWEEQVQSEDRFLITSDGVHGIIDETVIASILSKETDVERAVEHILDAAKNRGAPDNVSAVVVSYEN